MRSVFSFDIRQRRFRYLLIASDRPSIFQSITIILPITHPCKSLRRVVTLDLSPKMGYIIEYVALTRAHFVAVFSNETNEN